MATAPIAAVASTTHPTTSTQLGSPLRGALFEGHELRFYALAAQPFGHRVASACGPADDVARREQLVLGELGRQADLAMRDHVVRDDDLVHALEVPHAHQVDRVHRQRRLLQHLARDAGLGRLAGLHEAGDQREHATGPRGVASQQHLAVAVGTFDDGGQHRRRVVPVREAAVGAAQALLRTAVLVLRDVCERVGALGTVAPGRTGHAGNTPVDR